MQAMIWYHYATGAAYPVGGASQIAHSIIPVVQQAGGKVTPFHVQMGFIHVKGMQEERRTQIPRCRRETYHMDRTNQRRLVQDVRMVSSRGAVEARQI